MKIQKPHIILMFITGLVLSLGFVVYLQSYQRVIAEGFTLSDQHCIAINPLIIRQKQAYIDGMKTIQASGSAGMEVYLAYQDQYLATAKEYVKLEKLWLAKQDAFLKRPDVRFFMNPTLLEAAKYQYDMYRSELEGTASIVALFSEQDEVRQQEFMEVIARTDREFRIAQQGYDLKFRKMTHRQQDFRDQFIDLPVSQCPVENNQFPDIEQELKR